MKADQISVGSKFINRAGNTFASILCAFSASGLVNGMINWNPEIPSKSIHGVISIA
jgi:hypothetical protein